MFGLCVTCFDSRIRNLTIVFSKDTFSFKNKFTSAICRCQEKNKQSETKTKGNKANVTYNAYVYVYVCALSIHSVRHL